MRSFEPMPIMQGKLFYLRSIRKHDYLDIFEYGSDNEVTQFVSWGPMKNISEAKWVVENYYLPRQNKGMPIGYAIVYRSNDKVIGTIDFHTINFTHNFGEIGYVLNHNYQNMGIMSEALHLMIRVGFEVLNLNRIEIKHEKDNIASQKVIENADFRYEGLLRNQNFSAKKQKYLDICVYSILRSEYERGELKWQLAR